ncbi:MULTISPECIES: hypothetical protein [Bacillus]|uniref:hypothetical protein n=1 Tax=Bacillus TaxID=1386 RepID=UPI0005A31E66|nr:MULTISPECIES: hypothetical protein [Bacillus cereus group]AJG59093.1 hypothetical protein AW22_5274 [Bacillus cereus D17]MCX3302050.1 hypothetical protein [Bacillus pacificus]MCX3329646.1 hypothetical protein [Bacillus pacificus]MDA1883098.1 hypothetical protein [Bacillus cereus group sp. BY105LC]QKI12737.1 hypothetical protein FOC91_12315 [Bacillus cereus]
MNNSEILYKPTVPEWVAEILELDKKRKQNQYNGSIASGQTRKQWDEWKRRYSRKYKYAMLNGWIVEEG